MVLAAFVAVLASVLPFAIVSLLAAAPPEVPARSETTPSPPLSATPVSSTSIWAPKGGTLSADPQGWASHPSIGSSRDGSIYVVWSQHLNPAVWQRSSLYVKRWNGSRWEQLGGPLRRGGSRLSEAYDAEIAVLDSSPYVTWYEGGGYGWGEKGEKTSVFVAHWNGSSWVLDADGRSTNGALNSDLLKYDARNPSIAVVKGTIHVAWIETRPIPNSSALYNVVLVKRLERGSWQPVGSALHVGLAEGRMTIDVALADVGAVPHLAFSQWSYDVGSSVYVFKLAGDTWSPLGPATNRSPQGFANYLDLASVNDTPYVVWQEKTQTGHYQLYVSHWNGSRWIADGGSVNAQPTGEAGRPSVASDGTTLWLAWAEGAPGQTSQAMVRSLSGGTWSAVEGGLNIDTDNGAADTIAITVSGRVPYIAWAEKNVTALLPKQLYVKGRDGAGSFESTPVSRFGASGPRPAMTANTWLYLNAGGIAGPAAGIATGVGDEGFNTFSYAPNLRRSLTFGLYHAASIADGEDQNALLAYSFAENRWDVVEITEADGSEFLPGVGHDEGNATVDTVNGLYVTHGNLTVHGNSAYRTYVYDLKTGRGSRMMPVPEAPFGSSVITAFDPDHEVVLASIGPSFIYDRQANAWLRIGGGPSHRPSPALTYDSRNRLFVLFGGGQFDETWTLNPVSRTWTKKTPATAPRARLGANFAFDSANGVAVLVGGTDGKTGVEYRDTWAYDAARDQWTNLNIIAPPGTNPGAGNYLTYDVEHRVLLLKHGTDLNKIYALWYRPHQGARSPVMRPGPPDTSAPSEPCPSAATTLD